MGHDVQATANHQLNIATMPLLAADLAARLQVNVQYGYMDDLYIQDISNESYEVVILGKVEQPNATANWVLLNCHYLDQIKYPTKYADTVYYDFYDNLNYDNTHISIFRYCFAASPSFSSRWWNFCRQFNQECEEENHGEVDFYRKSVLQEVKLLGGEMAIYFDDQGPSAKVFDMEDKVTIQEIHEHFVHLFKDGYLNISQMKLNPNVFEPLKQGEYHLAFYDDFKDLK